MRSLLGFGTSGAVMAIAVVMVLSPFASAAGHTFRPPYAKAKAVTYSILGGGGCYTATSSPTISFNASNGVMLAGAKTSAKGCSGQVGGVGGSSYGEYEAEGLIGIPVHFTTAGLHSVQAHWRVNAVATQSMTPGTCYLGLNTSSSFWYCEQEAFWEVFGQAELVDTTNGSVVYSSNIVDVYNETINETFFEFGTYYNYSSPSSYGSFGNQTLYVNATTVTGHSYAVVTYLEVLVISADEAYNAAVKGGSTSATINMGTGPNKAVLSSVSVV